MELLSNAPIPDSLPASMTLLREKPRLGVPNRKSAPHQRIDERNCTAVLGLRFPCSETVSGTVVAPSKGSCTDQRVLSALMGTANLGLAAYKATELGAAVAAIGSTGAGIPAAAVLGVYGTVSITGQAISGVAQLYSAATGNYGAPAQIAQIGNILSGPVSGLGTLLAGGSLAKAETNAGIESSFTAGSGLVDGLLAKSLAPIIANYLDGMNSMAGLSPAPGGCGAGH